MGPQPRQTPEDPQGPPDPGGVVPPQSRLPQSTHWVLCALVLGAILNASIYKAFRPPFPPITSVQLSSEDALQSTVLLSLGMRRLAADLAFIQLLMYYGTPEPGDEGSHGESSHHEGGPPPPHQKLEGGIYAEIGPRVRRILQLDPYFVYAPLLGAGALGFNLNRPDEALEILRFAADWSPRQWKYRAYTAAIGFHKAGNPDLVIRELTPVLADPDCPTLLKNMVAFLNRRLGRREEAVRIYQDILRSRDPAYYEMARRALTELGAPPHPGSFGL